MATIDRLRLQGDSIVGICTANRWIVFPNIFDGWRTDGFLIIDVQSVCIGLLRSKEAVFLNNVACVFARVVAQVGTSAAR